MTDALGRIAELTDRAKTDRAERLEAMREARAAGITWRAIATAADMTENGVRRALGYLRT